MERSAEYIQGRTLYLYLIFAISVPIQIAMIPAVISFICPRLGIYYQSNMDECFNRQPGLLHTVLI